MNWRVLVLLCLASTAWGQTVTVTETTTTVTVTDAGATINISGDGAASVVSVGTQGPAGPLSANVTCTLGMDCTFTAPILLPPGTQGAPTLRWSDLATSGWYRTGTEGWSLVMPGEYTTPPTVAWKIRLDPDPALARDSLTLYRNGGLRLWDFFQVKPNDIEQGTMAEAMIAIFSDLGATGYNLKLINNTFHHDFAIFYDYTGLPGVPPAFAGTERFHFASTGLLSFGPKDGTAPALKASGTTLQVRLGDDTAFTSIDPETVIAEFGSATKPSYSFSAAPTVGMYYIPGNPDLAWIVAGTTPTMALQPYNLNLRSDFNLQWAATTNTQTAEKDVVLSRATAGTLKVSGLSNANGRILLTPTAFTDLGTPANGTIAYCSDCAPQSNPCTGTSTGAIANRLNGAWDCR